MWHSRLGHLSLYIFHKFPSVLNISFPKEHLYSCSCTSCNINKSHKLPFAKSSITSSSPFDIVFFYVWTSLISSSDSFNYYVIFFLPLHSISSFTRYVGNQMFIHPLSPSSNFFKTISPSPLKHFTQIMEANFQPFNPFSRPMV